MYRDVIKKLSIVLLFSLFGVILQDAQYTGLQPSYVDNGDGTVTDLNTELMWQQTPDFDNKLTYVAAIAGANSFNLAGYNDWRLPTIKKIYSLIDFNGRVFNSIVDYTRAPDAQNAAQQSAAIDPVFNITSDDSFFWSSATHMDGPNYWAWVLVTKLEFRNENSTYALKK